MLSLRDKVHRIPHPHISSSRTSLNSQKTATNEIPTSSTINNEDTISTKAKDIPTKSGMYYLMICIRRGLVVRISAFHAGGPGSIPGVGILFFCFCLYDFFILLFHSHLHDLLITFSKILFFTLESRAREIKHILPIDIYIYIYIRLNGSYTNNHTYILPVTLIIYALNNWFISSIFFFFLFSFFFFSLTFFFDTKSPIT